MFEIPKISNPRTTHFHTSFATTVTVIVYLSLSYKSKIFSSLLIVPEVAHVSSMPEVEVSYQLEHYRTKSKDWSFNYLMAGTRDSVKP